MIAETTTVALMSLIIPILSRLELVLLVSTIRPLDIFSFEFVYFVVGNVRDVAIISP